MVAVCSRTFICESDYDEREGGHKTKKLKSLITFCNFVHCVPIEYSNMELVVVVHGGEVKMTYNSVLIYYMNTPTLTPQLQPLPLKHPYMIFKPCMSEYNEI